MEPDYLPNPDPIDRNQLLLVIIILIWENLGLPDYIDYVGTVRVVRMGVRYVVTVATYDGGSHAYLGVLRTVTVQLAQACQVMIELLEIVTAGLHVDGSKEQADNIVKAVEELAKTCGVHQALEDIRAEVKTISKAYHSLKQHGTNKRQDPEGRQEQSEAAAMHMSRTIQAEDAKTLKAIGSPGSPERVVQACQVLDANRSLISSKNHNGVEPCPGQLTSGSASVQALLWTIFSVEEAVGIGWYRADDNGDNSNNTQPQFNPNFQDYRSGNQSGRGGFSGRGAPRGRGGEDYAMVWTEGTPATFALVAVPQRTICIISQRTQQQLVQMLATMIYRRAYHFVILSRDSILVFWSPTIAQINGVANVSTPLS